MCIFLDEADIRAGRSSGGEAEGILAGELILDIGHRLATGGYTIGGRVEESVRELDQGMATSSFFAHDLTEASWELQDR